MKVLRQIGLVTLLIAGLISPWNLATAQTSRSVGEAIELARTNLLSQQNPDGSIGDFGTSGWATMALVAAGTPRIDARFAKLANYLNGAAASVDKGSATELERTILALTALGLNPYNIGERNLINELKALAVGGQIGSPNLLNDDIFAILAFRASGQDPNKEPFRNAIEFVKKNQLPSGGFNDRVGATELDIDTTAAAIQALRNFADTSAAQSILRSSQNADGGFPSRIGGASNVASTSWVIWAIGAQAQALNYLVANQASNGSFGSVLVTSYGLQALTGRGLPIGFVSLPAGEAGPPPEPPQQPVSQPVVPFPQPLPSVLERPIPIVVSTPAPTPVPPAIAVPSSQPVITAPPQRKPSAPTQKTPAKKPATPRAKVGVVKPISQADTLVLVEGSYPKETLAQFSAEPQTVKLPALQQPTAGSSAGILATLIVLGAVTVFNTIGLILVWSRLSRILSVSTGLNQQPSTPS